VAASDPHFRVLRLSRNFGHQIAISAGLDATAGSAVVVMDGELRDLPEVAPNSRQRWREGSEIVHAVRLSREVGACATRAFVHHFPRRRGRSNAGWTRGAPRYDGHVHVVNLCLPPSFGPARLLARADRFEPLRIGRRAVLVWELLYFKARMREQSPR
jgi:hypothetical protein